MQSNASTKPTATWLTRSSMLAHATRAATAPPTMAAATNPTHHWPVSKPAANPARADSMRLPSSERLMTPDRSVTVSPMTAKISGVAAATIDASVASIRRSPRRGHLLHAGRDAAATLG